MSDSGVRVGRRSASSDRGRVRVECPRCGSVLELSPMYDAKTIGVGGVLWSTSKGVHATVPNSFALPAGPIEFGGSCPGHTSVCSSCYALRLESGFPTLARMVARNLEVLRHLEVCGGARAMGSALEVLVRRSVKMQRAAGIDPSFRWHSDGDVFSAAYARAIRATARQFEDVPMWIYTRSTQYVRHLVGAPNLRVYISADRDNLRRAVRAANRHGLPLALLGADRFEVEQLRSRVEVLGFEGPRFIVCPAAGKYQTDGHGPAHVVGVDGRRRSLERGELARGACDSCRVCLPDSSVDRSVVFLQHGGTAKRSIVETRVSIGGRL